MHANINLNTATGVTQLEPYVGFILDIFWKRNCGERNFGERNFGERNLRPRLEPSVGFILVLDASEPPSSLPPVLTLQSYQRGHLSAHRQVGFHRSVREHTVRHRSVRHRSVRHRSVRRSGLDRLATMDRAAMHRRPVPRRPVPRRPVPRRATLDRPIVYRPAVH